MTLLKNIERKTSTQTTKVKNSGFELSLTSLIILFILLILSVVLFQLAKMGFIAFSPLSVLSISVSMSFMVFIFVHLQASSKLEAVQLAQKLTFDLRRQSEHIERQKAQLESILKNVGNAIIVVDREQKVILMNEVAQAYTGFSSSSYQNKHLQEIVKLSVSSETEVTASQAIEQVLEKKEVFDIFPHGVLSSMKGEEIPVRGNIEPIQVDSGQVIGVVISLFDISRELQLEQDKNDFISMAAHQFKTPATSLKWQLEMMSDGEFGELPTQLKESVAVLTENTRNIIELVDDFLQISRISQKRVSDNPELVDVAQSIESILKEVQPIAENKRVALIFDPSEDFSLEIEIDKQRFHDVIENLVSNAIKYNTQNGSVTIGVAKQDGTFTLTVSDTGIGIPSSDQDKIFTRFFRAENAVESSAEGTGLGLYMIKSYIEAWGGAISLRSEENRGTIVTVTLPLQPQKHVLDVNL